MNTPRIPAWSKYQAVARDLLDRFAHDFGLNRVEGPQPVAGLRSKTSWELDAKGVAVGCEAFLIVECRRYSRKRQVQEQLAGLAYRVIDTGAQGGILVSPLGLQAGAQKVANAENIMNVQLDKDSTPTEFAMRFLSKLFIGVHDRAKGTDTLSVTRSRKCSRCGSMISEADGAALCPQCGNNSAFERTAPT